MGVQGSILNCAEWERSGIRMRGIMEIQNWKEILNPYELAVDEIVLKVQHIMKEYSDQGVYCPVENVIGRVKSISSILAKAKKKNVPMEMITERIEDIAGIRIICQFVDDIYKVVEMIKNRSDMEVKGEIDYVAHPKDSGYRSYHMVVMYPVQTAFQTHTIPVEIQIRTLAMNFWAVIEHSMKYKYDYNLPTRLSKRLTAASEAVLKLDNEMSSIRDEIVEAQTSFREKANIVHDILNALRNLHKVAPQEEVMELQDQFFQIYNQGDMEQLRRFSFHLEHVAQIYRMKNNTF